MLSRFLFASAAAVDLDSRLDCTMVNLAIIDAR